MWEALLEEAEDELDITLARKRVAVSDETRLGNRDLDDAFRTAAEVAARKPA